MMQSLNNSTFSRLRNLLPAILGCGVVSACGQAQPIRGAEVVSTPDVVATRQYIDARSEFERTTASILPAMRESSEALVTKSTDGCSGVVQLAPHNGGFDVVSVEATRAPPAVMREANRAAIKEFAKTIATLKWSGDPQLTLLIHNLATEAEAATKVGAPDLCGDLKQWSRSQYRTIPTSTLRFNQRIADVAAGVRSKEAAANWWQEHLPASKRGVCRRYRRGHHPGFVRICSGGPAEPAPVARERRVITEAKSIGEAIWKLLARYENGGMQLLVRDVQQREALLQADLKQTYYSSISRLSQSLGVKTVLLPTELGLLGVPGANYFPRK
jgi:hypothetical protein